MVDAAGPFIVAEVTVAEVIVAEVLGRVKLPSRGVSLISRLSVSRKLNDQQRDTGEKQDMNEVALMKNNFQKKPNDDQTRTQNPQHLPSSPVILPRASRTVRRRLL